MNLEFVGQNVHFAVNLLASLAMFSVFWLIFDAWTERRNRNEAIKWSGFLLLAIGFLINGAVIEQSEVSHGFLSVGLPTIAALIRALGYILVVAGQVGDPLMARPTYVNPLDAELAADSDDAGSKPKQSPAVTGITILKLSLLPVLPLVAAFLYWRRATTGLERHLKPVAIGFVGLALFEVLSALTGFQDSSNPLIYNVVHVYGPIWWISQAIVLAAGVIFGKWVWKYLTKRLSSQIFIVLVTTTVAIYFVSTVGFSFLLLGNSRTQALADLTTASHVLDYAVESNKAELKAEAETVAMRPGLASAANASDYLQVKNALADYSVAHHLTSLVVTDAYGKVLFRSEDPDRRGDSLSENTLVQRSLIGRAAATVTVANGVVAPSVSLVSAQPIRDNSGLIVGTVQVSRAVSSAFVDGIKAATNLDSTVYGKDQRSATTLKGADGRHRAVGIKETSPKVLSTVLQKGKSYSGEVSYQNRTYLAAYAPLKDADNNSVGMLLVARPASTLLAAATRSTELAFLTAVSLLAVSVIPVYKIARKIGGEVR